ncbi:unnamed protein product [Cuscuta europaea]|uniref:Transcriptional corepressor LEUNIG-like n=2 Tax=Cuscuta europaea TaxID=41803 RepID=A0A9P1EE51_CUSEU|nr:unnamed protein product [Cuscuta europaea]
MEADKMLDVYIYDYLIKRKMTVSAREFHAEAEVPTNRTAIDTPGGFLLEWWSIFWEIFVARFRCPPGSRNEIVISKSQEQQQQHQSDEQQQCQLQQQILQKHVEQQLQRQREEKRLGCATSIETHSRPSCVAMNALTRSRSSLPGPNRKRPMQSSDGINAGQPFNHSYTSMLTSRTCGDQHPRHGSPVGNLRSFPETKDQPQLHHVSHGPMNTLNPLANLKSAFPDASLTQLYGSNHGASNMPLKGWPLTGFERLQPGHLQQQNPLLNPSQPSQQLHLQQQIQSLLGSQYMDVRKVMQPHFLSNLVPDSNSPVQAGLPLFSHADDTLIKLYQSELAKANQRQQQCQRPTVLGQYPETSSYKIAQQDNTITASNSAMDATFSNTSRDNDQIAALRKRKQPLSSNPTNSSGTANTTIRPSQSTSPSSPSTHTMEDVISSVPLLLRDDSKSQIFCSSGADTNASSQMADIVRFISHGSMDDNVDSFLDKNVCGTEDAITQCLDVPFSELGSIESNEVNCCDFSCEGKLIATGGDGNKVVLWCTDSKEQKCTLGEHSDKITDVRFSPRRPRLASCSLDRMVKIWDIHNPGQSLRTFTGHSASVVSVDFHPNKEDLICSSDDVSAIRYWTIKNGGCAGVSKVAAAQVRFQPTRGRFLAAAVGNGVSLIDVETTQTCSRYPLKGHASNVQSVCWSSSGEYIASLSEDIVRVWKVGCGGDQKCVHELSITGKRFRTCTFHPTQPSVLVVGSQQCLELWNMAENKMLTMVEGPISTLAVSSFTGLVASVASGGNTVKLWK